MKPCALCGEEPALVDGYTFGPRCDRGWVESREHDRQHAIWMATGMLDRPSPDPWDEVYRVAEADYVRRVQAERRNGGAA